MSTDTDGDGQPDEVTDYIYDDNDRLLTETLEVDQVDTRTTSYSYGPTDLVGKTVTDPVSGHTLQTAAYSYNSRGRMAKVDVDKYVAGQIDNRETNLYTYDYQGDRVAIENRVDADLDGTPETVTHKQNLIDPQNFTGYSQVLEETLYDDATPANQIQKRTYPMGLNVLSQTVTDGTGSPTRFLHTDAGGSTRLLTDPSGLAVQRLDYDAFGKLLGTVSPITSLLYRGQMFDPLLAEYYLRARYYDPATGRFNRLDPFSGVIQQPQTLHKYAYAHGDPVNNADPTGKFSVAGMLAVGAIGGMMHAMYDTIVFTVGMAIINEAKLGNQTLRNILAQPKDHQNATIFTHGIGPGFFGIVGGIDHGWLEAPGEDGSIADGFRGAGLNNTDYIEFTWSGFEIAWCGIPFSPTIHHLAVSFHRMALLAVWSKGYDNINVVSHSWGATVTYDALSYTSVNVMDWVTLGSPLKGDTPKPSAVTGDWLTFYSNYDPVTWLRAHPPFDPVFSAWENHTWDVSAFRVNADAQWNMTGSLELVAPNFARGLVEEHVAYWRDAVIIQTIAGELR